MSWETYCDQVLKENLKSVVFMSKTGDLWAQKGVVQASAAELKAIADKGVMSETDPLYKNPLFFGGETYRFLFRSDDVMQLKKSEGGMCVAFSKKGIVVGVYDQKLQPGQASVIIARHRDHLVKNEY